MIGSAFENIIDELGKALKIRLKPDAHGACLLKFKNGLKIQIEMEKESLIMLCEIAPLSEGRYRENIFREALKANGLPLPRNGIFAYSKKSEALVIYDIMPLDDASGGKLSDLVQAIIKKAARWKEAISRGEVPSFTENEETFALHGAPQQGIFGLIR